MHATRLSNIYGPLLMRVLTLPISVISGLLVAGTLLRYEGVELYGLFTLLTGLILLFPFLDLGTTAPILNGSATFVESKNLRDIARPLRRSILITTATSSGVAAIGVAGSAFGVWSVLLGETSNPSIDNAVLAIGLINLLCRPLTALATALIGIGRPTVVTASQAIVPVVSLVVVLAGVWLHAPLWVFAISILLGQLLAGSVIGTVLCRTVPGLWESLVSWRALSGDPVLRLRHTAGPMLVITMCMPLATNLDRTLLNNLGTPVELAMYALAAQLFQPLQALLSTALQPMWAEFRRLSEARSPDLRAILRRLTLSAAGVAVLATVLLSLAAPFIAKLVSKDQISISAPVLILFSVTFVATSAQLPSGAYLNDRSGLRAQAAIVVIAIVVNLLVSYMRIPDDGAAGAVLGTLVGSSIILAITLPLAFKRAKKSMHQSDSERLI